MYLQGAKEGVPEVPDSIECGIHIIEAPVASDDFPDFFDCLRSAQEEHHRGFAAGFEPNHTL